MGETKPQLHVLTEDANPCCRRAWRHADRAADSWECPRCGCEYRPEDRTVAVVLWQAIAWAAVL